MTMTEKGGQDFDVSDDSWRLDWVGLGWTQLRWMLIATGMVCDKVFQRHHDNERALGTLSF